IDVKLKPGLTTDYIELRPFDVEGTLRIEVEELDGLIFFIYHIDDGVIIGNRTVVSPSPEPRLSFNALLGGSGVGLLLFGLAGYLLVCRKRPRRSPCKEVLCCG